jgi:phage-related holin
MKSFGPKYFIGDILSDLGFESFHDFFTSLVGFKNNLLAPLAFITGASISVFLQQNFWSEPSEIYFLAMLTAIDLFTGVWKALKYNHIPEKKFRSRRINRTVGKIITYSLILYISFNLDKNMHLAFFWMPYSCLGVFYATEAWSIIENLSEIGHLDKGLVKFLKEKLNIMNYLNKSKGGEEAKKPAVMKAEPKKRERK